MSESIPEARESRLERRKQRTRRAIVEAARDLFLSGGFEGTTLNEIAAQADVANSTVGTHFESKQDIFFADYELIIDSFISFIESVDPTEETAIGATIRWHNEAVVDGGLDVEPLWFDNIRRLIDEEPLLIALERQLQERGEVVLARKIALELGEPTQPLGLRVRMITSAISTCYRELARSLAEDANADTAQLNRYVDECIRALGAGVVDVPLHQAEPAPLGTALAERSRGRQGERPECS